MHVMQMSDFEGSLCDDVFLPWKQGGWRRAGLRWEWNTEKGKVTNKITNQTPGKRLFNPKLIFQDLSRRLIETDFCWIWDTAWNSLNSETGNLDAPNPLSHFLIPINSILTVKLGPEQISDSNYLLSILWAIKINSFNVTPLDLSGSLHVKDPLRIVWNPQNGFFKLQDIEKWVAEGEMGWGLVGVS